MALILIEIFLEFFSVSKKLYIFFKESRALFHYSHKLRYNLKLTCIKMVDVATIIITSITLLSQLMLHLHINKCKSLCCESDCIIDKEEKNQSCVNV